MASPDKNDDVKRIKQGHMQAQELKQRGERLNTMFRGHKEAKLRSLVENGASERQALARVPKSKFVSNLRIIQQRQ